MPQFNLVEKPEYKLENEALGLRGTADRVMEAGNHWRYIIDIKTGSPAPWHRWQIALYRLLYSLQHKYGTPLGAALYLSSDGTYRYVEHKDRKDPDRARALVTAAHILKECRA
jgi:RecB family exonuclease